MIQYRILVRVIPEGECRYRKSESQIPRLPEWSQYTEGGVTFTKVFSGKVELPHIKRWFRHDLYYKAYRLEYVAWHKTIFNGVITPPDKEYLDWIIEQIHPSPNELLIESRTTRETWKPYIFHCATYRYRFEEIDGVMQAKLEKAEDRYVIDENISAGQYREVPVDEETKRRLIIKEERMKELFPIVSQAVGYKIKCLEELWHFNPKDVEEKIGTGMMLRIEPLAKAFCWGSDEYWDELRRNAGQEINNTEL